MKYIYGVYISVNSVQIREYIRDENAKNPGESCELVEVKIIVDGMVAELTIEEFKRRIFKQG